VPQKRRDRVVLDAGYGMAERRLRLAADIGGTFTDIAVFDDKTGALTFGKALSTPAHLVEGISNGVAKAGSDYRSAALFLHGSTIAINTMLERTGARTALIITEGFRDIYEIGRINRPDAYNLFFSKARAADRAGDALRGQGAHAGRRRDRQGPR
jgi:N-methylhydantoinase A/oxoprolinase/acetone carboxylase beta subunit